MRDVGGIVLKLWLCEVWGMSNRADNITTKCHCDKTITDTDLKRVPNERGTSKMGMYAKWEGRTSKTEGVRGDQSFV